MASTVIAVPAHAHGAQRFWTLESFRRAGFPVTAMMNEPSAAGFEYTHRQPRTLSSRRTRLIVYDLGGGTFDASLVKVDGTAHEVVNSLGVNALGGDDFDRVLADLALEVGSELVVVGVDDFYAAATPLVEASLEAMRPLLGGLDADSADLSDIAGIYLVGGGSGLPLVPRLLRERFGRRVHRSPYPPAASTAIGLAIAADAQSEFSLTDRLSRGFGVFREVADGRRESSPEIEERYVIDANGIVTVRITDLDTGFTLEESLAAT